MLDWWQLIAFPIWGLRKGGWKMFRDCCWSIHPIRCVTCRRWFHQGDFWNPWGPGSGPGLACSDECCEAAKKE